MAAAALLAAAGCAQAKPAAPDRFAASPWRKLSMSDWKERLSPAAFKVLREEDTERPRSSPLNGEKRAGVYACAGCELPMFRSEAKFESGTGWPSFTRAIRENMATKPDGLFLLARTEYHCARCEGHQGHLFDDGPKPLGKRWCNNGLALKFIPA